MRNFYMIGVPKAGTTALAEMMRSHVEICVSDPKETYFWSDEFSSLAQREGIESVQDYHNCFSLTNKNKVKIECTTLYLYSISAIEKILKYDKDARFIVVLRDPVEVVEAFHNQLVFSEIECEESFINAWNLQSRRLSGKQIPENCICPELLQYRRIGSYADHLERVVELVGESNMKIVLFDEIKRDCEGVVRELFSYMGVDDSIPIRVLRKNGSMVSRNKIINRMLRSYFAVKTKRIMKWFLPSPAVSYLKSLQSEIMRRERCRVGVDQQFRRELYQSFESDIAKSRGVTGFALDDWQEGLL